jgi:integrase
MPVTLELGENMKKETFTVYQHLKETKAGKAHRWYYYYYTLDGKKVQKACKGCQTKEQAEAYVAKLPAPLDAKTENGLISSIANDMFVEGSAHMERRKQLGKSTYHGTMKESRRFVETIIQQWGDMELKDLTPEMVMAYLFSVSKAGKWKNKLTQVLDEIYSEAKWHGCRAGKIDLEKFKSAPRKADALTPAEITSVFKTENFPSYQFYLLFILSLAAGLRLGEARAVRAKQIVFERSLMIVDGFIQTDGNRTTYNKKGNPENPKFRIVYLNDVVLSMLRQWIAINKLEPDDLMFTKDGKPIRHELAETVFYKALQAAKIIPMPEPVPRNRRGEGRKKQIKAKIKCPDSRRLVPHSLRYTYVSMMLNHVTPSDLMPMTGHTSVVHVNYYHHKVLDMTVASLPKSLRDATDSFIQWEVLKPPQGLENQLELFPVGQPA